MAFYCNGKKDMCSCDILCADCEHYDNTGGAKITTNADHIRSMSDDDLAYILWKTGRNYRAVCADPVVDYNEQHGHIIDWLQQPTE